MGSDAPAISGEGPGREASAKAAIGTAAPSRRAAGVATVACGLGLGLAGVVAFGASAASALALGLYAVAAAFVVAGASPGGAGGFGLANAITLFRAALVALMAGALAGREGTAWLSVAAFLVLFLDGADGWWARRSGTASAFGARFDMETDALYVLVMSLLLWQGGRFDAWILVAGLARYAFVAAGAVWPALTAPLPPRQRRRLAFVAMAATMAAALSPDLSRAVANWGRADLAVAGALAFLVWSFAVDVVLLSRGDRARLAEENSP